ncbi:hypothetical protein [Candidatus Venteria ishoeyi]|uniref:Uncharacterized protein n=1 Tax=Candidatus Venteria ishoeyi TaxID=1899563 RepID=A0A1H6F8Y4_9GAMM|nr:hypothetical protein [Candidatus Venteria ishoeyi]SEH06597.1 Uncharacterised protein [Candidatus Venteria ishoeyi]
MNQQINRADLLNCLDKLGLDAQSQNTPRIARLFGLQQPAEKQNKKTPAISAPNNGSSGSHAGTSSPTETTSSGCDDNDGLTPHAVQSYQAREPLPQDYSQEPAWLQNAKPLAQTPNPNPDVAPLHLAPLSPWSRLWPVLRRVLGQLHDTSQPDLSSLLPILAQGQALCRMPWQQRLSWVRAWVIIDADERLLPFWRDFLQLRQQLLRLRGSRGLHIQHLQCSPYECLQNKLPPAGTPVLIVSNLGLYDIRETPGKTLQAWQTLGKQFTCAGLQAVCLLPCAPQQ